MPEVVKAKELNAKQTRLFNYYVEGLPGWKAAQLAGYKGTYGSLKVSAWRVINCDAFQKKLVDFYDNHAMSAKETLHRLSEQARAEYAQFIGGNGYVDLRGLREAGLMHLVKSVSETAYGRKVEFHDAQTALLNVGRVHGMFSDKVAVNWEKEVADVGLDKDQIFNEVVERLAESIESSA